MINTILVGFGFSATTFHLPFLKALDEYNVTGVVSSRPDDVKRELPDVTVYASLEAALESEATLFVITTPSHLHNDMIEACLKAGKDVLVEKPAFLSVKEDTGRTCYLRRRRRQKSSSSYDSLMTSSSTSFSVPPS